MHTSLANSEKMVRFCAFRSSGRKYFSDQLISILIILTTLQACSPYTLHGLFPRLSYFLIYSCFELLLQWCYNFSAFSKSAKNLPLCMMISVWYIYGQSYERARLRDELHCQLQSTQLIWIHYPAKEVICLPFLLATATTFGNTFAIFVRKKGNIFAQSCAKQINISRVWSISQTTMRWPGDVGAILTKSINFGGGVTLLIKRWKIGVWSVGQTMRWPGEVGREGGWAAFSLSISTCSFLTKYSISPFYHCDSLTNSPESKF